MSVISVFGRPIGLVSTHRPAIIGVQAANPDVVYCDVYFNDIFYKTIVSSSPVYLPGLTPPGSTLGVYQFDVSGVAREYLEGSYHMPTLIQATDNVVRSNSGYAKCSCFLRGSTLSNGVWAPQITYAIPVQGTMDSNPVAGGGLPVPPFYFLYSSPQFEDWPKFSEYLRARCMNHTILRNKGIEIYTMQTNLEEKVYLDDYNYMTCLFADNCFEGASNTASRYCTLRAYLFRNNGDQLVVTIYQNQVENHNSVCYYSTGIPNIKATVPGAAVDFTQYDYYYVTLHDTSFGDVPNNMFANLIARSPKYIIVKNIKRDRKRIWFRNDLGVMQAVNFLDYEEETSVAAGIIQYPVNPILQNEMPTGKEAGYLRHNVRSNETVTVHGLFEESEMATIMQLVKTSAAYVEQPALTYEATTPPPSNQPARTLQIRILDGKWPRRKLEDRWVYEVNLQYEMSMPNLTA